MRRRTAVRSRGNNLGLLKPTSQEIEITVHSRGLSSGSTSCCDSGIGLHCDFGRFECRVMCHKTCSREAMSHRNCERVRVLRFNLKAGILDLWSLRVSSACHKTGGELRSKWRYVLFSQCSSTHANNPLYVSRTQAVGLSNGRSVQRKLATTTAVILQQ